MVQILILLVLGYLLGSINLSVLVTKYIGKTDIRAHGSGNAGGTNVVRVMGAKWGISVMAMEILKGVILGFIARYAWPVDPLALGELGPQVTGAIAVIGVMFGNMYPCFHGFKGGKGVTTCGALAIVVDWRVFLVLFALFLAIFFISKIVSISSIIAATCVPVAIAIIYFGKDYWWLLCAVCAVNSLMLIIRHRSNIKRLINGTENKFNLGKKKD